MVTVVGPDSVASLWRSPRKSGPKVPLSAAPRSNVIGVTPVATTFAPATQFAPRAVTGSVVPLDCAVTVVLASPHPRKVWPSPSASTNESALGPINVAA